MVERLINIKPISTENVYLEKNMHDDILFTGPNGESVIGSDKDIFDCKIQLFSTMDTTPYVTYSNNVSVPIRSGPSFHNFHITYGFGSNKGNLNKKGVVILETITLTGLGRKQMRSSLDKILRTKNVDIMDSQYQDFLKAINKRMNNPNYVELRFGTFIKEDDINEFGNVYVSKYNLVISNRLPEDDMVHPNSKVANRRDTVLRVNGFEEPNIVAIDITDRHNVGKPYYIKIGNKVHTIVSTVDMTTEDGYSFTIKTNGQVVNTIDGSLSDINSVGIYESKDEAEYNGDANLKLTSAKLENELLKTKNDKERLEVTWENEKLKLENELLMLEKKIKHEELKHRKEIELLGIKYNNEINMHRMKIQHSINEHDQKSTESRINHIHSMEKSSIDILNNSIKLGAMLLGIGIKLI